MSNQPSVRRPEQLFALILVLAGFAAYQNSFLGEFIFDDKEVIERNPNIGRLWPPWEAGKTDHGPVAGRPVAAFSFALNYLISGNDVRGYHFVNLALHLANSLLVFALVRLTLKTPRLAREHGNASGGLAFAVALLWSVHPLLTESVSYISQRTELLMGVFYLATIVCVARAAEPGSAIKWQWIGILACALGMASKEVMVTAPLMAMLYDRIFLAESWKAIWNARKRFYGGLMATWLITMILLLPGHHRAVAGLGFEGVTPWQYAMTQSGVLLHYVRLAFWPAPLLADYHHWPLAKGFTDVALPICLVIALVGVTVLAIRRGSVWGFIGAWFFLILAPTSSLLPLVTEIAAERRMYLPLIAIVAAVVIIVWHWAGRLPRRGKFLISVSTGILALILLVLSRHRNEVYRNDLALWKDVLKHQPQNARARYNLGVEFMNRGRLDEASREYQEAIRANPNFAQPYLNLGYIMDVQGRSNDALDLYQKALRASPNLPEAHSNLARLLDRSGRMDDAIAHYTQAARFSPRDASSHFDLAHALERRGRAQEAFQHYTETLRIDPHHARAHNNLGALLLQAGKLDDAIVHFEAALRVQANLAPARANLALALEARKKNRQP